MKYAKKITAIIVLAAIISLPFTPQTAHAGEIGDTGVIELQPNIPVEGQQKGDTVYSFTMPGKGYVRFHLKNEEHSKQSGGNLDVFLHRSETGELSQEINQFFWQGMGSYQETQITECFNFAPGTTLYIKVSNYESLEEPGRGLKYELTTEYCSDSSWESEPNDDIAHATSLAIGKARSGTGYSQTDQDFYSFVATKNGTIKCSLSITDAEKIRKSNDSYTLDYTKDNIGVEILDKNGENLVKTKYFCKNTSISFKVKKGKKYFVHVSPPRYYGIDALYKIRVAYKK